MEEIKILEKLYEEARKRYCTLKREISFGDLQLENGWTLQDERKGGKMRTYRMYEKFYMHFESQERELNSEELQRNGFSSENPPLREFLKKNGLEKEIETFIELYSSELAKDKRKEINEAREQERRYADSEEPDRNYGGGPW